MADLLSGALAPAVAVTAMGLSRRAGPASSAWLLRAAAALRARAERHGALSRSGGGAQVRVVGKGPTTWIEWEEWGGPEGDLGAAVLPPGAPAAMRVRRLVTARAVTLVMEFPPGSLDA